MKKLLSIIFIAFSTIAFSQISMTSTVTNVSCFGLCDGSASVTTSGGTAPYTYWATNGTNTPNITNLCAGQYTVYVLDATSTKDRKSTRLNSSHQ